MRIGPLMELLPAELQAEVSKLILQKAVAAEAHPMEIAPALRRWIDETFAFCESASSGLPGGFSEPGPVDDYFLNLLRRYDDPGFTG